jgi:hypothetical protein
LRVTLLTDCLESDQDLPEIMETLTQRREGAMKTWTEIEINGDWGGRFRFVPRTQTGPSNEGFVLSFASLLSSRLCGFASNLLILRKRRDEIAAEQQQTSQQDPNAVCAS